MTGSPPLLQAVNLECQRGESLLFEALSFAVAAGEVLQVEGANGSGKTSLLRILAGLSPPGEGELRWRGEPVSGGRWAEFFAETAYLGHHLGLKADLTVRENLRFAGALGRPGAAAASLACLRDLGLDEREDLPVRALSAGQRQRVALARLLGSGALLWILDEPFTALDANGIALVQHLIDRHAAAGGVAILSSHHALELRGGIRTLGLA